jgi:hypothetical protein
LWLRATNSLSAPSVLEAIQHLVDSWDAAGQDCTGDVCHDLADRFSTPALGILALALVEDEAPDVHVAWLDQAQLDRGYSYAAVDLRDRLATVIERTNRGEDPRVVPWAERNHRPIVAMERGGRCAEFEAKLCPKTR